MPLPSSIDDLSTTAGSNSPAGSESPGLIDDYLRTYASYIAILRDSSQSNASGPGYIEGLIPQWNSATSISVSPGSAALPSPAAALLSTSTLTLSGLTLSAATWYYLYIYDNAGTPALELVTTAPSAPYTGTARTKTGDIGRRFIGALRTGTAANSLRPFIWSGGYINYLDFTAYVFQNVTSLGPVTTSAAAGVPLTTQSYVGQVYGPGTGGTLSVGIPGYTGLVSCNAGVRFMYHGITDAAQAVTYAHNASVTGGSTLEIRGYGSDR